MKLGERALWINAVARRQWFVLLFAVVINQRELHKISHINLFMIIVVGRRFHFRLI